MKHPLQCPNCDEFRYLEYIGVRFEEGNKGFGVKLPVFMCKSCGQHDCQVPQEQCMKFKDEIMPTINDGEFFDMDLKYIFSKLDPQRNFTYYDHLGFDYDSRDYYLIPGIYREHDDGYLTPVFFDKDILLYYNNHPDYSVKLYSFSSGNIYHKGERMFNWGFGINRNGKIFKWLGDLSEDFEEDEMKPHLKRFQASNVPSDHDIVSKFYFSQNPFSIKDAFQKSDNEYRLFNIKSEFEHKIKNDFKINLSKLDIDAVIAYYKHPILDDRNQIFEAYLKLDKLIVENLEQTEIRNLLLANGLTTSDLEKDGKPFRSLKLFSLFIQHFQKIENADKIVTPLFVVNDLRQLHGHLSDTSFDKRYSSCKERLDSPNDISDLEFFKVVVSALIKMFEMLHPTKENDE
ncbi:MAG: hypothetical protein IPQ10_08735 [Saprospiraceae bacterium]|nr:hypothetical protein [Saprospiraceae bacterium]